MIFFVIENSGLEICNDYQNHQSKYRWSKKSPKWDFQNEIFQNTPN